MKKYLSAPKINIKLLCFLSCLLISFAAKAQTLEEVDLSVYNHVISTYLFGINNKGYVCGYFVDTNGNDQGIIITPNGKRTYVYPSLISGATGTSCVGINDHNVVLISAEDAGGTTTVYKGYWDNVNDTLYSIVPVQAIGQTDALPQGLNNNNDMSGFYSTIYGGQQVRWLWVKQDSIVPSGNSAWEAKVYTENGTEISTNGTGINDNNIVCGFLINGVTDSPFIYNNYTGHTFTLLGSPYSTHLYGINASNMVVGEYKQTNGYWMGFYGQVSGSTLSMTSLNSIFQANTIESAAYGINNNGEIVGSYLDPNNNNYVGFIYRPNNPFYRLQGYNFQYDSWSMVNDVVGTNPVWPASYWSGFNYTTTDPYASNGIPLLDSTIKAMNNITTLSDTSNSSWNDFAKEVDTFSYGTNPAYTNQYEHVLKPLWFSKYKQKEWTSDFEGICYGFSYTSLLHWYNDTTLYNLYNIPVGTNLYQVQNTNGNDIQAIDRAFMKQDDLAAPLAKYKHSHPYSAWDMLYSEKMAIHNNIKGNATTLSLYYGASHGHSILPYKIKTPPKLPFYYNGVLSSDSVFVYDCNHPGDTTQWVTVQTNFANQDYSVNPAYSTHYGPNLKADFYNPLVSEMAGVAHAAFKTTTVFMPDSLLSVSITSHLYYNMLSAGGVPYIQNANGFTDTSEDNLYPVFQGDTLNTTPMFYRMDTNYSVRFNSYNYGDSTMCWSQSINNKVMGISRSALPAETDFSTLKNKFISYGTHDNVIKYLNGYLIQLPDDISNLSTAQGANILVSHLNVSQGDSLLTLNPSAYQYEIIRFGNDTGTYNLTVYTMQNDSVSEFSGRGIVIQGNSSHTIQPFYHDPTGGTSVVVYVDNGNNGTIDDTLFLPEIPLVSNIIQNADYVKVYPNPATNNLNVQIGTTIQGAYTIMISDIEGRTMALRSVAHKGPSDIANISIAKYAPGTYIVQIYDPHGQAIYKDKFIKE